MKDYASRNFEFSEDRRQDKVPIPWWVVIVALIAMAVIYAVWHRVQQKSMALLPVATTAPAPAQAPARPATATAKPAAPTPVKFDFYQMLTENPSGSKKAAVAESHVAAAPPTTTTSAVSTPATNDSAPAATPTSTDNRYYLQVGVHRTKAEALQQKANLILSEVSPKLIKVLGSNGRYRVIIGPYDNLDSATSERSDLRQNNINSSLIKDLKK